MGETARDGVLTNAELKRLMDEVAENAANRAVKAFRTEQKRLQSMELKDALYNTRLLLKNYHRLVAHGEKAICTENELRDEYSAMDIFSDGHDIIRIESLLKSRRRTIIMVSHMQVCLKLLEEDASLSEPLKLKAFKLFWIDKDMQAFSIGEKLRYIAEVVHANERTVRGWIDDMVVQYSSILWGIDGLTEKNLFKDLVEKGLHNSFKKSSL